MTPISTGSEQTLERHFYHDSDIFVRECSWFRNHAWLLVGHVAQIPKPGDFFLTDFERDSIIVVRDLKGEIRAHQNVCRHRGSRLCLTAEGSTRLLTCPYHAWSYELDGKLKGAPYMPSEIDKTAYSLSSCHVSVQGGLIFISLADERPDFAAQFGWFAREMEMQSLASAKVATTLAFSATANWKLAVENKLECYHCQPAHPTYCAAHPGVRLGRVDGSDGANRSEQSSMPGDAMDDEGRQFEGVMPDQTSPYLNYLLRQKIGNGVQTESLTGHTVARLMGRNRLNGMQTMGGNVLTSIILNPDYALVYTLTPRSARRTDIKMICLVHADAQEGKDYEVDELIEVWKRTLLEDKVLIENVQAGVDTSAYRPGPYAPSEKFVSIFDRWYLEHVVGTEIRSPV